MATPTASLIKTKTRAIDGSSIRYAESAPREVSAILFSPWPESPTNWIAADIFRIKDSIFLEHWDVIQNEAAKEESKSGLPIVR